jgi:GNAT superfamily N-acetyltransferase
LPTVPIDARVAGPTDLDAVAETIVLAFHDDPVWSWAFPDADRRPAQFRRWWPLFVESAIPHGWVWMAPRAETIAVWVPPGAPELSPEAERRIPPLLDELLGARAPVVLEGLLRFEAAHPHDEPHYYLSFVATHDDHRGRGIGEQLLARNLELIDAEHLPAYLESSNPNNLARYERLGFRARGEFAIGDGGPVITTMWRPAR